MLLSDLLKGIFSPILPEEFRETEISEICSDSRKAKPGSLFVALKGPTGDGSDFIPQTIEKGVKVIVRTGAEYSAGVQEGVCVLTVPKTPEFLKDLLRIFYNDVSRKVRVIGITGTNGKTTITYLLESILVAAHRSCGVIGTVNYRYGGKVFTAKNTTPGLIDIHRFLFEMSQAQCRYCAMEVSSHALDQGRVDGIDFRAAIFTNLTSDHLDYHHNREDYFLAKAKLFTGLSVEGTAVINQDDSFADRLAKMCKAKVLTFGLKSRSDFTAREIKLSFTGTEFLLCTPRGEILIQTPLIGMHNIQNILAAAAVCWQEGLMLEQIKKGIEQLHCVPGRLEAVNAGQDFAVLVDYAHTEDALKNVLKSLRQVNTGKIILVFGCGGDRDKTKRPLMGKVAGELADFAIITNDNPRSEDPQEIANQIVPGFAKSNFKMVLDRREAIKEALRMATAKDIVLIAGKGHEDYQIFKDQTIPFDERQIVKECLQELLSSKSA